MGCESGREVRREVIFPSQYRAASLRNYRGSYCALLVGITPPLVGRPSESPANDDPLSSVSNFGAARIILHRRVELIG